MIYKQFELHNVSEVEETHSGLRMYRFPIDVCNKLSAYGREVSRETTGCEIRFVTTGKHARITLTSLDYDGYVQVYCGDYAYYDGYFYLFPVKKGQATVIELKRPALFDTLNPALQRVQFAPQVWRIICGINMTAAIVDFEDFGYEVRPPKAEEVPEKTLLCYGTSLTYGACASAHTVSYVQLLGRLLGGNILNKAMGGSCCSETGVADYFASGKERFDAVLLENGVNIRWAPEMYRERTEYLLNTLKKAYPQMPIYCITSYPNSWTMVGEEPVPCRSNTKDPSQKYQNDIIMRELAEKYPNCKLIEGAEIMDYATDVTIDGIHLSDYGHIRVAQNLATCITL